MLLTHTHVLIVERKRSVPVETQAAVLTPLASGVVFTAHTRDDVDEINITATAGVVVTLAVWERDGRQNRERRE